MNFHSSVLGYCDLCDGEAGWGVQMLCSQGPWSGRNFHATQLEVLASGDWRLSTFNQDTVFDYLECIFVLIFPLLERRTALWISPVRAGSVVTVVLVWLPGLVTQEYGWLLAQLIINLIIRSRQASWASYGNDGFLGWLLRVVCLCFASIYVLVIVSLYFQCLIFLKRQVKFFSQRN